MIAFRFLSFSSFSILVSSGSDLIRYPSMLVRKLVDTSAPFWYVMALSVIRWLTAAPPVKFVRYGANRKNGISYWLYHFTICPMIENGGLSITTSVSLYGYCW